MWRRRKNGEDCAVKILEKPEIEQRGKTENDKIINLEEYRKRA